ncbi:MAG: hypothetical protein DHS20C09_12160 [marine bacterium B5-7]|nr:MAG: hypothetical protein DHS20C09_12160 [marine bacterium B5-7]
MKVFSLLMFFTLAVSAGESEPVVIPKDIKPIASVIPVFSQKVSFNLPGDWKAAFQDQRSGAFLIEFIPQDETIENWENLFSIQGFEKLADKTKPIDFLDGLTLRLKESCGEYSVYEQLGHFTVSNHKAFAAIMGCSNSVATKNSPAKKGKSELGYYIAIQGLHDYYLLHKSIRGASFKKGDMPINSGNADDFIAEFMPIELCRSGGEEYECNK